jgi:hypothetical protein
MAENAITTVKQEIDRIQNEITRRSSELAALNDNLVKHQRAYELLSGGAPRARRAGKRTRAGASGAAGWNAMLDRLPDRFNVKELTKQAVAAGKSAAYVRQVAVRWVKQKKTKRVGRGQYQKVQQGNTRAAAAAAKGKR